jgi:hypothetical protein
MRNVFIAQATGDAGIGASPKPTPAIVGRWIFCVNDEVDLVGMTQQGARDAEEELAVLLGRFESARLFSIAPSAALPPADKAGDLPGFDFNRKEKIALERQENGRPFDVLGEGEDRRANFPMGAKGSVKINGIFAESRRAITDN